jgi:hypothetical protein
MFLLGQPQALLERVSVTCTLAHFSKEVVQKLKFPNNSIIYFYFSILNNF